MHGNIYSSLADNFHNSIEHILRTHVLGPRDVVRPLLVLPRRLVDVENLGQHPLDPLVGLAAVPRLDPLLLAALRHVQDDEHAVRAEDAAAEIPSFPDLIEL